MRHLPGATVGVVLAGLAGLAAPASADPRTATVPFEMRHDYLIVVRGSIGPVGNLTFLVDTGATGTTVDRRLAGVVALERQRARVLNFDRAVRMERGQAESLQIGPLDFGRARVLVGDLRQLSDFADGIDAVIGLDVLSGCQRLAIDYGARRLLITVGANGAGHGAGRPQVLVAHVPVQGRRTVLVVDTGLQGMLLYADRIRAHVPELRLVDRVTGVHEGRLAGVRAGLPGVQLGPGEEQESVLLLKHAPHGLDRDIDGYLGTRSLHASLVELDFVANVIRWR